MSFVKSCQVGAGCGWPRSVLKRLTPCKIKGFFRSGCKMFAKTGVCVAAGGKL